MNCPLCLATSAFIFAQAHQRNFFQCKDCHLVFVPAEFHLSEEKESERYRLHHNDPVDPRYQEYLKQMVNRLLPVLKLGSEGLDFGSGESTFLAEEFKRRGYPCESYDLYFHPDVEKLNKTYDYISVCEVIEHVRDPHAFWISIEKLLKAEGKILIRTAEPPQTAAEFASWYYPKDPTHITFWSKKTWAWVARKQGYLILDYSPPFILLQKQIIVRGLIPLDE